VNPKEVTYENFLRYAAAKFESERARTELKIHVRLFNG
jgi:hypothetical protein